MQRHTTRCLFGALLAAGCLLAAPAAEAALLYTGQLAPPTDETRPEPVKALAASIPYVSITGRLDGASARTRVEIRLRPGRDARQAMAVIPLSPTASRTGLKTGAGPDAEHLSHVLNSRFLDARQAEALYQQLARQTDDPSVLALIGRPAVLIEKLQLREAVTVVVEYESTCPKAQGVWRYRGPAVAAAARGGAIGQIDIALELTGAKPLRGVISPTHDADVQRADETSATVRARQRDVPADADAFELFFVAEAKPLGLRLMTYRPDGAEDGYFMLFGRACASDAGEPMAKDVTFVLDASGSMRGEKIAQARAAIEYCLGRLDKRDRFNVIAFGTEVRAFADAPAEVSDKALDEALAFTDEIVARGRTNISEALARAVAPEAHAGRLPIVLFLTDGVPTAGELATEAILETVEKANRGDWRVFVMGVGHDVNAHLLDKLAEATSASSEYASPGEEIDVKLTALYDRLSAPLLTDLAVDFGELSPHSVYPKKLPAVFRGSDILLFGRYRGGGTQAVRLTGTAGEQETSYRIEGAFPADAHSPAHEFLAPLWASRKIGYLLQEIRLHGENDELITEVVRLSRKFGIVTEYTRDIAVASAAGGPPAPAAVLKEAKSRLREARSEQAGQWAVNQAFNDKAMQHRQVAGNMANSFLNADGREVQAVRVQQFGRRALYFRDGRWEEAADGNDAKTRRVELFSKEYMTLLKANPEFAKAQKLSWAVTMNIGGERIEVVKDGKTADKKLIERIEQREAEQGSELPAAAGGDPRPGQQQILPNQQIQQAPGRLRQNLNQAPQAPARPGAQQAPAEQPAEEPAENQADEKAGQGVRA